MDYSNAKDGNITLALAKYEAPNKVSRLGTIFINPGGPGASGIRYLYDNAEDLSTITDGMFDLVGGFFCPIFDGFLWFVYGPQISWDPRGVGESR